MGAGLNQGERKLPATPWGQLPPQMRVLFITSQQRTGAWLAEALASDSASEVQLEEAVGIAAGLARLREELFDAVLVSHETDSLDALEVLDAIRAGTCEDQPIIVLGDQTEQEMAAFCFEAGGDAYLCVHTATIRALIWLMARAIERHALIAENRHLQQTQRHRLRLEHAEAHRLLQQQRAMIADLAALCRDAQASGVSALEAECDAADGGAAVCATQLADHYRELLRAYVIMGSGNLAAEMERLTEMLAQMAVTPQQAMLLHLRVLEEMITGLGSRSARHVMNRADMLVLEVMIHLAEQYRARYLRQSCSPLELSSPQL
jgi:DNA-binding response OmpR family regulator